MSLTATIKTELDKARADAASKKAAFNQIREQVAGDPAVAATLLDPNSDASKKIDAADAARCAADELVSRGEQQLMKEIEREGGARVEPENDASSGSISATLEAFSPAAMRDFAREFANSAKVREVAAQLKRDPQSGVGGGGAQLGEVLDREQFMNLVGVGSGGSGAFAQPKYDGYVAPAVGRPRLQSLIESTTTNSDTIKYSRLVSRPNSAAFVSLATTVEPGAEDGLLPMGNATFEMKTDEVKTIGEGIPVHAFAIADAGQLEGELRSLLDYDLARTLEVDVYGGGGLGEHLLGITNTPGIGLLVYNAAYNLIEQVRRGITAIRMQDEEPTWIAINPLDGDRIRFLRDASGADDSTGGYLAGSPFGSQSTTLWGLPLVEIAGVEEGKPLVGSTYGARLYVRDGVNVALFDQHKDWAMRLVLLMRAYTRMALAVRRPRAFCEVEITA